MKSSRNTKGDSGAATVTGSALTLQNASSVAYVLVLYCTQKFQDGAVHSWRKRTYFNEVVSSQIDSALGEGGIGDLEKSEEAKDKGGDGEAHSESMESW